MTYSENYNFALPRDEDGYDIAPISENFETLDSILAENEAQTAEINEKIGTPTENGQTLFSLLNATSSTGFTAIKSFQRVTSGNMQGTTGKTVSISPVDPEKCICIFERLNDGTSSGTQNTNYTLTENSVSFIGPGQNYPLEIGLWIIEFC